MPEEQMIECPHARLGFHSGGFYVGCLDCHRMWVALKPERINDGEIDPECRSPLAGFGQFVFQEYATISRIDGDRA